MGSFRRSGTFGLVGVVVTAAAVAVVAQEFGQGQANPKGALAAIFAIIAAYVSLLFLFQTLDLNRAERASVRTGRPCAGDLANPAVLDEPSLWAAMAVDRIDAGAIEARRVMWGAARASLSTAKLITLVIFLTVPPVYLLDTFLPLASAAR